MHICTYTRFKEKCKLVVLKKIKRQEVENGKLTDAMALPKNKNLNDEKDYGLIRRIENKNINPKIVLEGI